MYWRICTHTCNIILCISAVIDLPYFYILLPSHLWILLQVLGFVRLISGLILQPYWIVVDIIIKSRTVHYEAGSIFCVVNTKKVTIAKNALCVFVGQCFCTCAFLDSISRLLFCRLRDTRFPERAKRNRITLAYTPKTQTCRIEMRGSLRKLYRRLHID